MTVQILTGDCRELLPDLPPHSFDCIVTDPPYGETSLAWDRWPMAWPTLVRHLLKPTGSMWVFGSFKMFWERRDEFAGWRVAQEIIWEKHNGSGFHADRFKRVHEYAVQFYRDDAPWAEVYKAPQFTDDAKARTVRAKGRPTHMGQIERSAYVTVDGGPRLMRSVISVRSEHGTALHPTQKPEGIVEPLMLYACPPGGRVLDPFAGSGTTGVVAKRLGRQAVLIEVSADYAEVARARVEGGVGPVDRARIKHGAKATDPGPLFSTAAE